MKPYPKALIVLLFVWILSVPVAAVVKFFLTPLWSWIELTYQIESIGHSGPAEWCFVAVYLGLVTFSERSLMRWMDANGTPAGSAYTIVARNAGSPGSTVTKC